ncbi:putative secreted protein [Beggiatoa alba B18LD]|uniref:Putative secreted protein n=1 Tax=Beggiatoa alba B18LD TaxID=395493 RepID=I3CG60_9GAMM|nr:DUF2259 domain-containing protein [Beggiatoa alba]EIJ42603.1 putative secreted protein [Beggiatoa alba B18LD]
MKKLLTLILCGLSLNLWAGDAANLHFIGFAQDGKTLAFEQYGVNDGNAAPYSTLYIVDVLKNDYLIKPFVKEGKPDSNDDLEKLRTENKAVAQAKIKELGISDKNQGIQVISHPLSDLSADPHKVTFALGTPLTGLIYESFTLTLEEQAGKAECFGFGDAKQFTLSIQPTPQPEATPTLQPLESLNTPATTATTTPTPATTNNPTPPTTAEPPATTVETTKTEEDTTGLVILQADKKIPETRGCPLAYRIQDVYIYNGEYIAVFINIFSPGFEGQNMRYIVVTGKFRDVQG